MKNNLIRLCDYIYKWKQIFAVDSTSSTIQFHINEGTGELEICQMNDEGEAIRTCLSTVDSVCLSEALKQAHLKVGSGSK